MRSAVLLLFVFLGGCVQVAPNLKLPEPVKTAPIPPPSPPPPVQAPACPTLAMPAIPKKVTIIIDKDQVAADDGGEALLRAYVKARGLLRP